MTEEQFRKEVQDRLVDTFEMMIMLNLRTRTAVWKRVEAGTLPPPVFVRERQVALWDKKAVTAKLDELARDGRLTVA